MTLLVLGRRMILGSESPSASWMIKEGAWEDNELRLLVRLYDTGLLGSWCASLEDGSWKESLSPRARVSMWGVCSRGNGYSTSSPSSTVARPERCVLEVPESTEDSSRTDIDPQLSRLGVGCEE